MVADVEPVEVQHVDEVDDGDGRDDVADGRGRVCKLLHDDLGDGFGERDDAFAQDDEGEERHALDEVGAFEGDDFPF